MRGLNYSTQRPLMMGLLPAIWLAAVLLLGSQPVSAFSFDQTIERCRKTVGRPIVMACMGAKSGEVTGVDFDACRAKARPRVRACVRRAMVAAYGSSKVEQTIEHCRQSVGRPIVKACMITGAAASLEGCRSKASPHVRACVRINIAGRS
jgi:hypothetical protein